jgi:hypothetical protein
VNTPQELENLEKISQWNTLLTVRFFWVHLCM